MRRLRQLTENGGECSTSAGDDVDDAHLASNMNGGGDPSPEVETTLTCVSSSDSCWPSEATWSLRCGELPSMDGDCYGGEQLFLIPRGMQCTLEMEDGYGDGWNGCSYKPGEIFKASAVLPALASSSAAEAWSTPPLFVRWGSSDSATFRIGGHHACRRCLPLPPAPRPYHTATPTPTPTPTPIPTTTRKVARTRTARIAPTATPRSATTSLLRCAASSTTTARASTHPSSSHRPRRHWC